MKRSAVNITCRKALVDEIIALRALELRAGKPIDSARFPEDTLDSTLHFGAWNRELLIGCLTLIANAGTRDADNDMAVHQSGGHRLAGHQTTTHLPGGPSTIRHWNVGHRTSCWQLRGMATASDWKRSGVGKTLLLFAENTLKHFAEIEADMYAHGPSGQVGISVEQDGEASARSIIRIWCNARHAAVPFYKKMGFRIVSDLFRIEHIGPHYKMEKFLDVRSD